MSFAAAQYRAATVETGSPVQIVVRLYDAAIRNMTQGLTAINNGDMKERHVKLQRGHAIVSELLASLERKHAPELCTDLDRLYEYVLHSIRQAHTSGVTEGLESSVRVLRELRGAWAELAANPK